MSEPAIEDTSGLSMTSHAPTDAHRLGLRTRRSYLAPDTAVSPELVLGPALLDAVLQVVRGELQARLAAASAPPSSPWMTPPAAAQVTRVPVKSIRAWAREGRIPKRLKNRSADPKQQKYLVNVDDVVTVAQEASTPADTSQLDDLKERARARAQEILAAREKGR